MILPFCYFHHTLFIRLFCKLGLIVMIYSQEDGISRSCESLTEWSKHVMYVDGIDIIHHWCSVETGKSQPEGPPF